MLGRQRMRLIDTGTPVAYEGYDTMMITIFNMRLKTDKNCRFNLVNGAKLRN